MTREEIIEKVKNAGVVGAGGAGFPSHLKLNTRVDHVIANGLECEPLLQVDKLLMAHYPGQIIKGLRLIMKAVQAKQGTIALKKKYKIAYDSLIKEITAKDNIQIKLMDNYYPAGDEHNLTYEVTDKTVPERGLPIDVSALVHNVGTLYNIYNAVHNKPVINKLVTVTGEVNEPATYYTAIGTPIKRIIDLSKVKIKDFAVINGGPLTGIPADYHHDTVTKVTSGLIILPKDHILIRKKNENITRSIKLAKSLCIQCNNCTTACPRNALGHDLKPHLLMRKIGLGEDMIDQTFADAMLCCECGLCGLFACPMDLIPNRVIRHIKSILQKKGISIAKSDPFSKPRPLYHEKRIPTDSIVKRLGLWKYSHLTAPLKNKKYSSDIVRIFLKQHLGSPSVPIVEKGDQVKKEQLIAEVEKNSLGARIHASIDGTVTEITQDFVEIKN